MPLTLPKSVTSEAELDDLLTQPSAALVAAIRGVRSPLVVFGASGKMGPSLCVLARRAAQAADYPLRVVGVSRFSDAQSRSWLESRGIETIQADLLTAREDEGWPEATDVIYLVGQKFGTQQAPWLTWAINTLVPAAVIQRYPRARMVALSTGNVYPFLTPLSSGATEETAPVPIGEYGWAALARERILEHYSREQTTAVAILRLNYAVELRYGVLAEIAQKVWLNEPVDVTTGYFNCLWQGDANDLILRSLVLASSPPAFFNLTGPSILSVREVAARFGILLNRPVQFHGHEAETALLSNSSRLCSLLDQPPTPLENILTWTADWVRGGGRMLGKPTHFEVRSGVY